MLTEEITLGLKVRYPRTGTAGKIVHVENIKGEDFAELDSTGLLYRIDQLIPMVESDSKASLKVKEDAKQIIAREREFASGTEFQESLKNIDQSCEGGG
jgi:hypothetical protein